MWIIPTHNKHHSIQAILRLEANANAAEFHILSKESNFMFQFHHLILKDRNFQRTCLREMGKVNLEENSGTATNSMVRIRQLRQTPAQATTFRRDGQSPPSAVSTLIRISLSSSSGSSDQLKGSEPVEVEAASWTTRCGLERISWIKLRIVMRWDLKGLRDELWSWKHDLGLRSFHGRII